MKIYVLVLFCCLKAENILYSLQEIYMKLCMPAGSHKEKNALACLSQIHVHQTPKKIKEKLFLKWQEQKHKPFGSFRKLYFCLLKTKWNLFLLFQLAIILSPIDKKK